MTTQLHNLRRQLGSLRSRRRLVRWGVAGCVTFVALFGCLLALFALDVVFEFSVPQRVLAIAASLAIVAFAFGKWAAPHLAVRESLEQVALMVERRHAIDSDLVAALQFESPAARDWGSAQLETAVIDRVAGLGRGLDVFEGFSARPLAQRAVWAVLVAGIVWAIAAFFPDYATVFARRLLLSGEHYPSDTHIDRVTINGQEVLVRTGNETAPKDARLPQGSELTIEVVCTGDYPAGGVAELKSLTTGRRRTIELTFVEKVRARNDFYNVYRAALSRFVDPLEYKLKLGDAWTDPAKIEMAELPVVEMRLTATRPAYARATRRPEDEGARNISVLEGSRVDLSLRSVNGKRLTDAQLIVSSGDKQEKLSLVGGDESQEEWRLPVSSPLASVREEILYELRVRDEDGLAPAAPIAGAIRIRRDRPPHGSAAVVHQVVLPTARPVVSYQVTDDFGIGEVRLVASIEKQSETSGESPEETATADASEQRFSLRTETKPIPASELPYRGELAIDLARLKLVKGDRLALSLEVVDHRGDAPGEVFRAEPIVLEISDESGVLAAISAADERSEQRLNEIIEKQLGIGEKP